MVDLYLVLIRGLISIPLVLPMILMGRSSHEYDERTNDMSSRREYLRRHPAVEILRSRERADYILPIHKQHHCMTIIIRSS